MSHSPFKSLSVTKMQPLHLACFHFNTVAEEAEEVEGSRLSLWSAACNNLSFLSNSNQLVTSCSLSYTHACLLIVHSYDEIAN